MNSPGHRRNMLLPDVRVYGVEQVDDQGVITAKPLPRCSVQNLFSPLVQALT